MDKKFSSLESDLFDLGATLTRGREKEYISSNLLKVQYRSSRPENLVDETTENGDVSLSLPDGLVNNFRTKALLVTVSVCVGGMCVGCSLNFECPSITTSMLLYRTDDDVDDDDELLHLLAPLPQQPKL